MNTSKRDLTRIRHNTKIVATLGPGSNNVQLLEDMIRVGGLNVVRFNFSHGTAEFHQENARIVRDRKLQSWPTCRGRKSALVKSKAAVFS